jgi:tRNA(fMet)-specific endonuclease VapC
LDDIECKLLDTTFLIDLQRELRRQKDGSASNFLQRHKQVAFHISMFTYMEFAEGFSPQQRSACDLFLMHFHVINPDVELAWRAAQLSRSLRADGQPIGDHDTWIAATALQHGLILVTRNCDPFKNVHGLKLAEY